MTDSVSGAASMARTRAMLGMLDPIDSSGQGIDRMQLIAELKANLAAIEAVEMVETQEARHAEEAARGVAKARRGNGLDAEFGLARGESPARGARCLRTAGVLVHDMPKTLDALALGEITEEHAQVVVKEVSYLSSEHRGEVDTLIAGQFEGLGPRKLADKVRAHAQRLDQAGAVERNEKAISERRLSVRPAADGMAYLTALLPTPQAVGVFATLTRDANSLVHSGETAAPGDPTGQPRTRDQIMVDLFVLRTTGQDVPRAVPAEVQLVMSDDALFGEGETPAWLTGHGPIPAELARQWIANPEANIFLRRVFARPKDHQLVDLESQARFFPANLKRMVMLRDDTCRTPYCDAPIRDIDHATPHRDGGPTSWENASGLCAACNQIKENIGWEHDATPDRLSVKTPTGHQYAKNTGPVLAGMPPDKHPPDKQPSHDEDGEDIPLTIGPIDIAVRPMRHIAA